jgi:hypothetical protein
MTIKLERMYQDETSAFIRKNANHKDLSATREADTLNEGPSEQRKEEISLPQFDRHTHTTFAFPLFTQITLADLKISEQDLNLDIPEDIDFLTEERAESISCLLS